MTSLSNPMPDAAAGERVSIFGANFGGEEMPITVTIGGLPCADAKWVSDAEISCVTPPDVAGVKNLTLSVGNRTEAFGVAINGTGALLAAGVTGISALQDATGFAADL